MRKGAVHYAQARSGRTLVEHKQGALCKLHKGHQAIIRLYKTNFRFGLKRLISQYQTKLIVPAAISRLQEIISPEIH